MTDQSATELARILLIDDSKFIRRAAEKMLGDEFDLLVAEDGEQGWKMIQQDPTIQVVFSDLMMPVMDGFQVLEQVRKSDDERIAALPLIVVTGADNSDQSKEKAYSLGATDFITKPFNGTNLKARAHAHVSHQRKTKTLLEQVNLDPVTGLFNKEGFDNRLQKDISFICRHQYDLAVLLVEIDNYKELYEQVGRKGYDSIVRQIANVLQEAVRNEDTVARVGLARFMVSLPTAKGDGAVGLARRICDRVAGFNVAFRNQKLELTVSMGLCSVISGQRPELSQILKVLTTALAQAQKRGRGEVCAQGLDGQTPESRFSVDQLLTELKYEGKLKTELDGQLLVNALKPLLVLLSTEQKRDLLDD